MPVGNNATTLALQLEKVHSEDLDDLFALDSVFWKNIKARPKDTVSTRPERVPFKVYPGGKARQVTLDGDDLGRGGAPQLTFGTIAPVAFDWALEWTKLAEIATDDREKAVENYLTDILKEHARVAANNIDSLLSYGDGSNTLGTVTAYDSTNHIITVDNAARFYAGQDVDYYAGGLGTGLTETITILATDNNHSLYLSANPTTNPVANGILLENQSSGTANTGLNGILAYQTSLTNTGTYLGVARSSFPVAFTTPNVAAGSVALSPALARLLLNQLKLARGVNVKASDSAKFHCGLDQAAAWENAGITVTQILQTGDTTGHDMLSKEQVSTVAGIPLLTNLKAIQGRMDLIDFSTWYRTEVQALDFYEVEGKGRVFPIYGASGGLASSFISYMIWMGNIVCANPRKNAFISGLTIPTGY